jgi:hypothetical protein
MKRTLAIILVLIFGVVGLAHSQSAKDVYKAFKKAQLSATGPRAAFESAMTDADVEFDLFKDSQEAKKNSDFTYQIKNARGGLAQVKLAIMGYVLNVGMNPSPDVRMNSYKEGMDLATRELEEAKRCLK